MRRIALLGILSLVFAFSSQAQQQCATVSPTSVTLPPDGGYSSNITVTTAIPTAQNNCGIYAPADFALQGFPGSCINSCNGAHTTVISVTGGGSTPDWTFVYQIYANPNSSCLTNTMVFGDFNGQSVTAVQPPGSSCMPPCNLSIVTLSLANGTVNSAYSQSIAAQGGTQPYTWTVSGLPAGLAANPQPDQTDLIDGIPTQSGLLNVSVQVRDALGCMANTTLSLQIQPQPLSITTTSLPTGAMDQNYDSGPLSAVGGQPFPPATFSYPYTWSATGVPAGLNISYFTGEIYGLPEAAGSFFPTNTVHDFSGATASKDFALVIQPGTQKSRFSPQQKTYFALLAEFWLQKSDFWEQQYLDCKQMTAGEPPADETAAHCDMDAVLVTLTGLLGVYYNSLAGDPADPNFTIIAQPASPSINLPETNSSWSTAQIAAYNTWTQVILTAEKVVGLAQAQIICVNRAEGAYEAGNSYWEQQQVQALNRYAALASFEFQVLISQIAQLDGLYAQSGFQDFSISVDEATHFELGVAANGLDPNLELELSALGVDPNGLAYLRKAWSSFDPSTTSGNVLQHLSFPSGVLTTIQQLEASFITPFASFSPTLEVTSTGFQLVAPFTLGTDSDGVNPTAEDVSFSLGTFGATIPAGNFRVSKQGYYQFEGNVNGVTLQAIIKPTVTGYELQLEGSPMGSVASPVAVDVWIGNDAGNALVNADNQ